MTGHSWRHFDPLLLVAALALTVYGTLVIYSASLPRGAEGIVLSTEVQRHITFAIVGALLMIGMARIDYRLIDALGWFAYGFGVLVLVLVLLVGSDEFGARRWFDLGFTVVQASEIGKLMMILGLAKFLTDYRDRLQEWRIFAASLAIAVVPAFLVFLEPDAGSAVVFVALWLVMTAFAGARLRHYATLAALGLCMIPVGLAAGVQDYQRDRIRAFIDPTTDPQGAGFNVIQAETSVGSGGLWGQGLTQGTQTQLDFVRIQTTDFIFSVLGEELGFVGAMALFALTAVAAVPDPARDWESARTARSAARGRHADDDHDAGVHQRRDQYPAAAGHGHPAAIHQPRQLIAADALRGSRAVAERPRLGGRQPPAPDLTAVLDHPGRLRTAELRLRTT